MAENLVNSIIKALRTLDILLCEDYERKGITLSSLSKQTGIRPNTLHNILKTMIHCGYVRQNENSCYLAGSKCEQIGSDNRIRKVLEQKIQPILKKTCRKVNEGIVFYTLMNGGKVPQISINNDEIINIDHSRYNEINFYEKITSRVLAAFADKAALQEIIERWGFPGKHWDNLNDEKSLEKALEKIRKQGFGILNEIPKKVISFAVPVLDKESVLMGTIGCFAPEFRCDLNKRKFIIESLKEAAEKVKSCLETRTSSGL